tara:strand:- start:576 stop:1370 length:795 start_codon:yes stop_codon:yes gene_type:complete
MIVVIPTKNESKHILRAISSARNLSNKIYVVDSQSKDSTIDLALSQNVEIIQTPNNLNLAEKMNFIYHNDLFKGEYIFCHHADEIITKNDAELVKKALEKEKFLCYSIVRKLSFMGYKLNFGGIATRSPRLALANSIKYEDTPLDERVFVINNKIKDINAYIYDVPIFGFDEWIAKHNRYSALESELIFRSKGIHLLNKPIKLKLYYLLPPIIRPFMYFIFRYIFLLGFLDRLPGFLFHLSHSLIYRLLVDIKILLLFLGRAKY